MFLFLILFRHKKHVDVLVGSIYLVFLFFLICGSSLVFLSVPSTLTIPTLTGSWTTKHHLVDFILNFFILLFHWTWCPVRKTTINLKWFRIQVCCSCVSWHPHRRLFAFGTLYVFNTVIIIFFGVWWVCVRQSYLADTRRRLDSPFFPSWLMMFVGLLDLWIGELQTF